jgi:2-dehydro-3-deoxy-D-arabinonate dehydratase
MLLIRYFDPSDGHARVGIDVDGILLALPVGSMSELLRRSLAEIRSILADPGNAVDPGVVRLCPIDGRTEVWASGVTYRRSREARIAESVDGDVYSRVYNAQRPELFFKSAAWRVVTDGEPIGARLDSEITVPEPELAVLANAFGELVGYTVCADVSSRDIEGANPLYLPQAKIFAGSCALATGVRPAWEVPGDRLGIRCTIHRGDDVVWDAVTDTGELTRTPKELLSWLFRADRFPDGVMLSTGTGIVPDLGVGRLDGDVVTIAIDQVGVLRNPVRRGLAAFGWLTEPRQPAGGRSTPR